MLSHWEVWRVGLGLFRAWAFISERLSSSFSHLAFRSAFRRNLSLLARSASYGTLNLLGGDFSLSSSSLGPESTIPVTSYPLSGRNGRGTSLLVDVDVLRSISVTGRFGVL